MGTLLERRFVVAAPPGEVWDRLADVESWPSWAGHIKRVRLRPPGALGPSTTGTFRLGLVNGARASFRMTRFDPPRSWTWQGKVFWLRVDYDHELSPRDGGTGVVFRVRAAGAGVGSLGRVFARAYGRNLDRAVPRFVAQF